MAASQELKDAMKGVSDATDEVAVVVTNLRDSIKTGMTASEVADAKATADAAAARLRGIAADPDVPVPPPTEAFTRAKSRR